MSIGDMMFAIAEWLRSTWLVEFALWISETKISLFIQTNFWIIPTLQTIHILAIAATFSSVLMVNLRILGFAGKSRTIPQVVNRYYPWVWWGLLVLLCSGLGLTIGEPIRELMNGAFWIKMALVSCAALIALGFYRKTRAAVGSTGDVASGGTKLGAVLITLLWMVIMVLGRWIAYVPT